MSKAQKPDNKDGAATKVKDESKDRSYFTITPRLVWALSQNPQEYTLWGVVKDIAGEDGECILSREDLCGISAGSLRKGVAVKVKFKDVSENGITLTRKGLLQSDTLLPEYFEEEHREVRYT